MLSSGRQLDVGRECYTGNRGSAGSCGHRNSPRSGTRPARLRPLALSSDDPDYAAQLARILGAAGHDDEARHWRRLAAARFDELIASHPAAFADHAAEFWLAAGADPVKGLRLARMNVEVRKTPRSRRLLTQAALANAGP